MPSHIIAVSGPEGVGKDTLINRVLGIYPELQLGRKATTRQPRADDCDTPTGEPKYEYLSSDLFMMMKRTQGLIVEHSRNANGQLYGSYVDASQPGVEIRDLDVNGALQLYAKSQLVQNFPAVILVGILPSSGGAPIGFLLSALRALALELNRPGPSFNKLTNVIDAMLAFLEERLVGRGDDPAVITQKLARAAWEIPEILITWNYQIINDDLDEAVKALRIIVDQTFDEYAQFQESARFRTLSAD